MIFDNLKFDLRASHHSMNVSGDATTGRSTVFSRKRIITLCERRKSVAPAQLFIWKKRSFNKRRIGRVKREKNIVASETLASARIKISELQRLLGRKVMEVEILRSITGIKKSRDEHR
jgi:hypothetical protein